ncbi:3-hydroxyacyl-[acyl-carrier-protein] dehydratase [Lactobacillus colini]|uniref:3-hydroxyacyl-[acyl-carrier-protein] dehydratase n=1 Tax=Lactobacillus colini TaxID=1819254 RepID=A0ABS4MD52_9LACO|nr:3-hydroxyacyl-[acyl-carrier-protein] dehydratase [Lactobacillus colini]
MTFDASQIQQLTGKSSPLALLDRASKDGNEVVATTAISANETFFKGHFPNLPVMPGVLIVEAMCQAACVLFDKPDLQPSQLKRVRFKKMVQPGDQLTIKLIATGELSCSAKAYVGDEVACSAVISFI